MLGYSQGEENQSQILLLRSSQAIGGKPFTSVTTDAESGASQEGTEQGQGSMEKTIGSLERAWDSGVDTVDHRLGKVPRWEVEWLLLLPGMARCFLLFPSQRDSQVHAFKKSSFLLSSVEVWAETGLASPGSCIRQEPRSPTACVWEQLAPLVTRRWTTLHTAIVGTWTTPTWGTTQAAHPWPAHAPSHSKLVPYMLITHREPCLEP